MKTKEILNLARIKQKEVDKLWKEINRRESAIGRYYTGRFVKKIQKGIQMDFEVLPRGYKELGKNGVEYVKEGLMDDSLFWDNPGVSYTPESCFCMICGSTRTRGNIQLGIAPRFATCAKHSDFLFLYAHLKRISTPPQSEEEGK